jgi:hypothetical protein
MTNIDASYTLTLTMYSPDAPSVSVYTQAVIIEILDPYVCSPDLIYYALQLPTLKSYLIYDQVHTGDVTVASVPVQ